MPMMLPIAHVGLANRMSWDDVAETVRYPIVTSLQKPISLILKLYYMFNGLTFEIYLI